MRDGIDSSGFQAVSNPPDPSRKINEKVAALLSMDWSGQQAFTGRTYIVNRAAVAASIATAAFGQQRFRDYDGPDAVTGPAPLLGPPPRTITAPAANTPHAAEPDAASTPDFALLGQFGSEVAQPVALAHEIVTAFSTTRQMTHSQMRQLLRCIEDAMQIARQSQQIARLAEGRLRQSHENIRLDEMVQQMLAEREDDFGAHGLAVVRNIKPVEIIVDAGLLSSLIDAAMRWAASGGRQLVVSLGIKNWPEHGILALRTRGLDQATTQALAADSLTWQLMHHTAMTMGVTLEREVNASEATLLMEFARTVKQMEGLTTVEMDASGDSQFHNGTKPMAGLRILLISNDPFVCGEVDSASRLLGVQVDSVPNMDKAQSYLRAGLPHLIVIDERLRDETFDQVRDEIKTIEPNFGFLEIADQFNTFEISSWMSDSMTRVSRDVLRTQLPSVLTLELARAQ
jgi:hypothetical protein